MFYSNSMLSRKGGLGNIWDAAFCFNKLKKEEITCTNISSSIDKILPDAQIPYRVLSQLLLGIVKIFSKKVDILFQDCNEALMKVSMSIQPKEATGTRQCKGAVHDVTITIPERFELDSFDLGIQEDVDTTELHQENIMEDALPADRSPRSSLYESYRREAAELAELTSACLSPLADVLPSLEMDIDVEINNLCNSSSSEAEGGEFPEDSFDAEEYENNESMETRNLLGSTFFDNEGGNREHLESLGEIVSQSIEKNSLVNQPEIHTEAVVLNLPETTTSDPHEGIAVEGQTEDETPLRCLDIVVCDPNPGVSSRKPKRPTPAYKQRFQLVVKRKPVLDETVFLPNESFIHEMTDTSNLLRKRRKVPSASLDVWKASRRANAQKVFKEPLITGLSSKLKDLYMDKLPNASSSDLPVKPVDSQNVTEPVDFQNVVEPADLQTERPDEPSKTVPVQEQENISLDNPIPETPDAPTADVYEMEPIAMNLSSPNSEQDMTDGDFDYHGDDTNEEDDDIAAHGDDSNEEDDGIADHGNDSNEEDDGIESETTREAAKFLFQKFASNKAQQNEPLYLSSILHGNSRNNCAKIFYETLALKNSGFVDVIQDSPYSDIILTATPKLGSILEKH